MATRRELAPSGYAPPPSPFATSGYDPTQAPQIMRASSGGGSLAPSIVEYTPPDYDEKQVQAYQQEALAPSLAALRRSMREVQAGRYASPTARSEALRGAARGYGEALAPLQVGASAQARQRYDIQYQQALRGEELRVAEAMRAREMEEREALKEEAETERFVIGRNAAGFPIYGTREEAAQRQALIEAETQPSQIIGLTEASRRPIYDPHAGYVSPLQAQPTGAAPGAAYPSDWMT